MIETKRINQSGLALVRVLIILVPTLVLLWLCLSYLSGRLVQDKLIHGVQRLNVEQGLDARLDDYQRGFFFSEARLSISSGGMEGDIKLDIRHGPVLTPDSTLAWAKITGAVPGNVWWPGLRQAVKQLVMPDVLPDFSPDQRRELPPIEFVAHALWHGDVQTQWHMTGFGVNPPSEADPVPSMISWVAGSARLAMADDPESGEAPWVAVLDLQAPAISHPMIGRMAADTVSLQLQLNPSADPMVPYSMNLDVQGGEWLRMGSRIYLAEFNIGQSLDSEDWARELKASVANGRVEPFAGGKEVTRVSAELDIALKGIPPQQWRYILKAMFNHGLDDSLWSDMATNTIELDVRRAELNLNGAASSAKGQLSLDPPGEEYAMIYEKLSGALALSFNRLAVSILARYRAAPYFTPLLEVKIPKARVQDREWFLERELKRLTEVGLLNERSPDQFQVDLEMDTASLSVNGSSVARWDQ